MQQLHVARLIQLHTMLSMKHITPIKEAVQSQLSKLSDTADTLELQIRVQTLWMIPESVFIGGNIAKQMLLEAKKFAQVNVQSRNW